MIKQVTSKTIIICVFLVLISSCSSYTYKIAYNQLDNILYLQVDKYFKPDSKQEQFVRQKLASLLRWNKNYRLTHYRSLLLYLKKSVQSGLTKQNAAFITEKGKQELKYLANRVAPHAATFSLTLKKDQIDHYIKQVEIHRKEQLEKQVKTNDPVEKKLQSSIKFLSQIYGSFSDNQTKRLRIYIKHQQLPNYDRFQLQKLKRNQFITLINNKANKEKLTNYLVNWLTRERSTLPAGYGKKLQAEINFNTNLYVFVDQNIVTQEQRATAVEKIDDLIEVVDSLIQENGK